MELLEPGNLTLPLLVGLALLAGFIVESLMVLRGAAWYFAAGLPLPHRPLPFPRPARPVEAGEHAGLRFRRIGPGMVAFWADRSDRRLPTLLHGLALEQVVGGQVSLQIRWAPPITPLLGASWLIALGLARGEGQITVPIGLLLIGGILLLYQRGAVQACRSLRFALQQEERPADEG